MSVYLDRMISASTIDFQKYLEHIFPQQNQAQKTRCRLCQNHRSRRKHYDEIDKILCSRRRCSEMKRFILMGYFLRNCVGRQSDVDQHRTIQEYRIELPAQSNTVGRSELQGERLFGRLSSIEEEPYIEYSTKPTKNCI